MRRQRFPESHDATCSGHGARNDDRQPDRRKFQAKTQLFRELHETAGDLERRAAQGLTSPNGLCDEQFVAVKRGRRADRRAF